MAACLLTWLRQAALMPGARNSKGADPFQVGFEIHRETKRISVVPKLFDY